MITNYVNILGFKIKLSTNSLMFNDFVMKSSNLYDADSAIKKINIKIHFNDKILNKKCNFNVNSKVTEYFGSEIYMNEDKLFWDTRKLKILIKKDAKNIDIDAIATYRFDQKLRKIFNSNSEFLYNMFIYVHRFAILYPILSLLSNNSSLVHASAVYDRIENKSILFIGLNGVGKSSLAFGISKTERYDLLSDNFVLINGKNMKIVPELLRLPKDINARIEKQKIIGKANNKILLQNKQMSNKNYEVGKLIFVSRDISPNQSAFTKLTNEHSFDLLSNLGSYLKEYENHHYTSFFGVKKNINDIENYQNLIKNTNSFKFKIGNEKNNILKLLQFINS